TMGPAEANRYAKGGFLLPLDPFIAEAKFDQEFPALALDVGKVEGKTYSLPKTFESMGIIYNQSLFDEYGWKPPTNRSEWVALCEAIKAKGIIPVAGGNVAWRPTNEHYVTVYLNHYSGPQVVYEALTGKRSWEDPLFIEAMETFKQDFLVYWPEFATYSALDAPDFVPMVATRKAAMLVVGSWAFQWLVDPAYWPSEDRWGWAPFPSLREGVEYPFVDVGIGSTLSVNNGSKYTEEAARFLIWMLSNREMVAKMLRDFPGEWVAPVDIPRELVPPEVDPVFFAHVDTQSELMKKGAYGYTTWTFLGPETWQWCYEGIEDVWLGKLSAQEYMKKWNEIFQKELQVGVVPPIPERR
ncbi:MAG: extracellular solute-binding protein, partial [Atribacterota bacterium]